MDPNQLVGMPEKEAVESLKKLGITFRIALRDGEPFFLTMDYKPTRINLSIKDGIIIGIKFG